MTSRCPGRSHQPWTRALPNSLTILHITAPAHVGGLESVVLALAAGHLARGHRVQVAAVLAEPAEDHPFVAALEQRGIPVASIRTAGRGWGQERRAVRALCSELAPSVVHTHGYRADVLDAGVARSLGVPIVTTIHGFTGGDVRNRLYEWVQRRALRRFDAVVAVSNPLASDLRAAGVPGSLVHVIPNGFDADAPRLDRAGARQVLGLSAHGFVAGWVGRLSREKGPDVFLHALELLADPDVEAVVVGDGPDRSALEQGGVGGGSVHWAGVVPAAGTLHSAFDVFVLSSRTEGIPIVLLEAMAAGTPIVATRVGGVPDMLSEAEALLVAPDDPPALADAIAAVRRDPVGARERAARARDRLRRQFSLPAWLDRYEVLYRSLVRGEATGEGGAVRGVETAP